MGLRVAAGGPESIMPPDELPSGVSSMSCPLLNRYILSRCELSSGDCKGGISIERKKQTRNNETGKMTQIFWEILKI